LPLVFLYGIRFRICKSKNKKFLQPRHDPQMSKKGKELLKNLWREQRAASAREKQHADTEFRTGQLYFGACDYHLKSMTRHFPAVVCTTHPVYVLEEIANLGAKLCPCTTNIHFGTPRIRKGCKLPDTRRVISRTSYVLIKYGFTVKKAERFRRDLSYTGMVPHECFKEPK